MLGILDEDVTANDKVGETSIKLSALCANGGIDEWFEIQYKGKIAGKVHLRSVFTAKGASEAKFTMKVKVLSAELA